MSRRFFCAIDPSRRDDYVKKMASLLKPQGKLVGVLFDVDFGRDEPPFGGTKEEYQQRFASHFDIDIMERCYNSHPARQGSELFIKLQAK
ncbi:TPMT family class I SAM-dependent methyltransferase [Psychrobacter sp. ENNN9_III]|uniref:TPMT family class I SAM-dependent methyltransferase n=1 Tax=Psychrobacter sp. ENNN9_III TaxID=1254334 RepID=UPI000A5924D2|nr:TPMT family class I SAM-dependent methyltransferase [Psychrobacter sp. ENNN9_III]